MRGGLGLTMRELEDRRNIVSNEAANEATRRAWRALGFFCDRNDAAKEWRIVGSDRKSVV